jgi:hypothetical protein
VLIQALGFGMSLLVFSHREQSEVRRIGASLIAAFVVNLAPLHITE